VEDVLKKNHASQIFALDFLTQHTALFTVAYIVVIMEVASRGRCRHCTLSRIRTQS